MKQLVCITLLAFFISCQSSKITHSWTAKNTQPNKFKKILVFGVLNESEKDIQLKIEEHLTNDLKALGYNSYAANKIFPEGTFIKGDTLQAAGIIIGQGFDAVLTIVLLDKKKEKFYVPGRITDYSNYDKLSGFNKYYNAVSERLSSPAYFGEETKYIWENNFYDISKRKMIYSARSRTFDITLKKTLAHTYGLLMAQSLVNNKILALPQFPDEE